MMSFGTRKGNLRVLRAGVCPHARVCTHVACTCVSYVCMGARAGEHLRQRQRQRQRGANPIANVGSKRPEAPFDSGCRVIAAPSTLVPEVVTSMNNRPERTFMSKLASREPEAVASVGSSSVFYSQLGAKVGFPIPSMGMRIGTLI